jgi:hypothetical protein
VFGKASQQACLADAQLVQQASDIYQTSRGQYAATIDALVAAGLVRAAPSTNHGYLVTYDPATGRVTAVGACTFP